MADQRSGGISWTNETWNPVRGCRRANSDCINCYAERLAATRLAHTEKYRGLAVMSAAGEPRWSGELRLDEQDLVKPLAWQRPRMVFVNAMSDLFLFPFDVIDRVVAVMAMSRRHIFQVLTKRPAAMAEYLSDPRRAAKLSDLIDVEWRDNRRGEPITDWPLSNVWWGASMGHQAAVDAMMPDLVACRPYARVLWVSAEPLTEVLDFTPVEYRGTNTNAQDWLQSLDWMVGGGESGPDARPTPLEAARRLRDACDNRTDMGRPWSLPFHWKQWGEWLPAEISKLIDGSLVSAWQSGRSGRGAYPGKPDHWWREYDPKHPERAGVFSTRVGRREAGRLLDGRIWDDMPRGFEAWKSNASVNG